MMASLSKARQDRMPYWRGADASHQVTTAGPLPRQKEQHLGSVGSMKSVCAQWDTHRDQRRFQRRSQPAHAHWDSKQRPDDAGQVWPVPTTGKNRLKPEKTSGKIASRSGLQERLHLARISRS